MNLSDELQLFLSPYSDEVRAKILWARKLILDKFPQIAETIDHPAKLVAYSYGNAYKDMICVLIPSRVDAKLSFSRGADLIAEFSQLQGDGKKTRYLSLFDHSSNEQLINDLLEASQKLYEAVKQ